MRKKILSMLLAIAMCISLLPASAIPVQAAEGTAASIPSGAFSAGNGSFDSPYAITRSSQIKYLDAQYGSHWFELKNDINMSDQMSEVGDFTGHLEGRGHTISRLHGPLVKAVRPGAELLNFTLADNYRIDLYIERGNRVDPFRPLDEYEFYRSEWQGSLVNRTTVDDFQLGCAAGVNEGLINNVTVKNARIRLPKQRLLTEDSQIEYGITGGVGFLCGRNRGDIVNSTVTGATVQIDWDLMSVGGLVGINEGNIYNSIVDDFTVRSFHDKVPITNINREEAHANIELTGVLVGLQEGTIRNALSPTAQYQQDTGPKQPYTPVTDPPASENEGRVLSPAGYLTSTYARISDVQYGANKLYNNHISRGAASDDRIDRNTKDNTQIGTAYGCDTDFDLSVFNANAEKANQESGAGDRSYTWLARTSAGGYPTTGYTSPLDTGLYSVTELSDGINAIKQTYVPKGSTYTRELMNHKDLYFQDEWDVLDDGTGERLATIRATADTPAEYTVNQSVRLQYKPEYQAYLYPHPGVHMGSVYDDGLWWTMGRTYNYELLYDRWDRDSHYEKIPNRNDPNPEHPVAKYFDQVTLSADAGADGGSYWFTYQKQNAEGTQKIGSEVTSIPEGDYGRYQVMIRTQPDWELDDIFSQAEWESRKSELWYFGPVTGDQLTIRNHVAAFTGRPVEADIPELDGLKDITVKYQLQDTEPQPMTAEAPTAVGVYNLYVTSPEHIYKRGNSGETYEYKDCWQASTDAFVGTMEITEAGMYISVDGEPQIEGFYLTPDGCATKIPLIGGVIPMASLDADTEYDLYREQQKYDTQDLKIWSFTPGTQTAVHYNLVEMTVHGATDGPVYQIPESFTDYHSLGETGKWRDEYARSYLVPEDAPLSQLLSGAPAVHTYRGSDALQVFEGWYTDDGVKVDPAQETAVSVGRSLTARYQAPADPEGLVKGRTYYFYDADAYGSPVFTGRATEGPCAGYGNLLDGRRMIPMIYAGGYRKDTFYKTAGHQQSGGGGYRMSPTSSYDYHFIGAETYEKPSAFFYQESINDNLYNDRLKQWNPLWHSFMVGADLNNVLTVVLPTRGVDHYSLQNSENNGITVPWNDIDQMTRLLGDAMPEAVAGGEGCRDLYLEDTDGNEPKGNAIPHYVKRMPDGSIEMPRVKFQYSHPYITPDPDDLVSVRLSGSMNREQLANSVVVTVDLGDSAGTALEGSPLYLVLPVKDGFYALPSVAELGDLISPTLRPALWTGNDGKSYPIGAKIPAAVTTLTASAGSAVVLDEAACRAEGLDPAVYSGYYAIRNENDFSAFAHLAKEQQINAVQLADITFSSGTETRLSALKGIYDGGGHTMFGAPVGLFDTVAATGVIRNVTFDKIGYQSIKAGALINTLRGTLEKVHVKNPVDHLVALAGGNAVLKDVHVWDLDWRDEDLASRRIPSSPASPEYAMIGRGYVGALVTDLEPNTNLIVTDCSATGTMKDSRYGRSGLIRSAGGTDANVTLVRCRSNIDMGNDRSQDAELILRDGTLSTYKYNDNSNSYDPVFTYTNTTASLEDCLSEGSGSMARGTGDAPFLTIARSCAAVGYAPAYGDNYYNCYSRISDSDRLPLGAERAYLMDTNNDTVAPRNFWGVRKDGTIGLRSDPEYLPSYKLAWHDEAGSYADANTYLRDGSTVTLANRPAGWDMPDMSDRLLVTDQGEPVSLGSTVIKASTTITWKMEGADQTLSHIFYEFEPGKFKHYTTQSGQPLNILPAPYMDGHRMLVQGTQEDFIPGVTKAPAAPGSLVIVEDRSEGLTKTEWPTEAKKPILQGDGSVHLTHLKADTYYLVTNGLEEGASILDAFQGTENGTYDWALAASKKDAERLLNANTYYLIAVKPGQTASDRVTLIVQRKYEGGSDGYLKSTSIPFGSVQKISELEAELGYPIPREKLSDGGHYLYNAKDDTLTVHQLESFKIYVNTPETTDAYAGLRYIQCNVEKAPLPAFDLKTPIQRTFSRSDTWFQFPTRDELKVLFADQGLVIDGVHVPPTSNGISQSADDYIYIQLPNGSGEYTAYATEVAKALNALPKETTSVELNYRLRVSTKDPYYTRDGEEDWITGTMQVDLKEQALEIDLAGLTINADPVTVETNNHKLGDYEITYGDFDRWGEVIQLDPSRCSVTLDGEKQEGTFKLDHVSTSLDYFPTARITQFGPVAAGFRVVFLPAGSTSEKILKTVNIWVNPKPLEVIWDSKADFTFGVGLCRPTATLEGILPRDEGLLDMSYTISPDDVSAGEHTASVNLEFHEGIAYENQPFHNYTIPKNAANQKKFVIHPLDMSKATNVRLTDAEGQPINIAYNGTAIDLDGREIQLRGTYQGQEFKISTKYNNPLYALNIDFSSQYQGTEPGTYTVKLNGTRNLTNNGEPYSYTGTWSIISAEQLKAPVPAEGDKPSLVQHQCTPQGPNSFSVLKTGGFRIDPSQSSFGKLQYRIISADSNQGYNDAALIDWQDTVPYMTDDLLMKYGRSNSMSLTYKMEVRVKATNTGYTDSPAVTVDYGRIQKIDIYHDHLDTDLKVSLVGPTEFAYDGTSKIPQVKVTYQGNTVPQKYYKAYIDKNGGNPAITPGTYKVNIALDHSIWNLEEEYCHRFAGTFTITATKEGTVSASILNPKPNNTYTYGDSITVEATAAAEGSDQMSLAAVPGPGYIELYYVDSGGSETELVSGFALPGQKYTLTYQTANNLLPIGKELKLRVRYGGMDGYGSSYFDLPAITLNKASMELPKDLTAETRTFKADSMKIRVPDRKVAALGGKTMNFGGIVSIKDNRVGENKTIEVPLEQLMSNYKNFSPWYDLPATLPVTYTILPAKSYLDSISTNSPVTYGNSLRVQFMPRQMLPPGEIALQSASELPENWAAIYTADGTELTRTIVEDNKDVYLYVDTTGKKLSVGEHTLTVRYGGSSSASPCEFSVKVEILPRELELETFLVDDRPYRPGDVSAPAHPEKVTLGYGVIENDDVTVDFSGVDSFRYDGDLVSVGAKPVHYDGSFALSGTDASYYRLKDTHPDGFTGKIVGDPQVLSCREKKLTVSRGGTLSVQALKDNILGAAQPLHFTCGDTQYGDFNEDGSFTAADKIGTVQVSVKAEAKSVNNDVYMEYLESAPLTFTIEVVEKHQDTTTMTVTQEGTVFADTLPDYVLTNAPDEGTVVKTEVRYDTDKWTPPYDVGTHTITVTKETADTIYTATASFEIVNAAIAGSIEQKGTLLWNGYDRRAEVSKTLDAHGYNITVRYGTTEDSCDSYEVPVFTDVGTHTVYYTATAYAHDPIKGQFTVTIENWGTVVDRSASSLSVRLTEELPAKAWRMIAAGYDRRGRMVAAGSCLLPNRPAGRTLTLDGFGFDKAVTVRLFLLNQQGNPITVRAESLF